MMVELVTLRVSVTVPSSKVEYPAVARRARGGPSPFRTTRLKHIGLDGVPVHEYHRADLLCADEIAGPAIIREATSTTFVPAGRAMTVGALGELEIK